MHIAGALRRLTLRSALLAAAAAIVPVPEAAAHTVSIGYTFSGPGAVTVWYGTYHAVASFNEADVQLIGPQFNQTVAFTLLSAVKPTGLTDGTTNFYSNTAGTMLVGTPEMVVGNGGSFNPATQTVRNWQGATFTGLRPGTYTFTYNPLSMPTVEWNPINNIIRSDSFTLTFADVLGISSFTSFGQNHNQRSVASGLDGAILGGAYNQLFYNLAMLAPADLARALTILSGELATGAGRSAFQVLNPFLGLMIDPFVLGRGFGSDGFGPGTGSGWGSAGGWGAGSGAGGGAGYDPWGWPQGGYGDGWNGDGGRSQGSGAGNDPWGWPNDGQYDGANAGQPRAGQLRQTFDNSWSVWSTVYGVRSQAKGDPATIGSHDVTTRTGGLVAGADYRVLPTTVVGFAVAGANSPWSLAGGLGSGTNEVFQAGLYGSTEAGSAYLSGSLAYGFNRLATDRGVTLAGNDRLTANYTAYSFGGRTEAGYRVPVYGVGVTPYGALQVMSFSAPSYREIAAAGAGTFALDFEKRDATTSRAEAGVWLNKRLTFDSGFTHVLLRGRLAYAHDWSGDQMIGASFPQLPGSNFSVIGASLAANSALATFAGEVRWRNGFSLNGKFDGEFAKGATTLMGTGTVRYVW